MKPFNVLELANAVGGVILGGDPHTAVTSVSTDSRTVGDGALFIPIVGEKFDGHDFIDKALAAGAAGCLCDRMPEALREERIEKTLEEGKFFVRVKDTTVAYKDLAAWYRAQFSLPVVQITGSVGKTTCKEMIASVLAQKYRTLKTEANFNNEIGTPMTLLRLDETYEAAVIETGMDRAGQIRYLGEMVKPDVAVITNIGDMHIEYLGSREGIYRAKCEIFENLAADGAAFLNGDDEWLDKVRLAQRVVRAGKSAHCDARVSDIRDRGIDGITCTVSTDKACYTLDIPAPGAHMIYPASIAAAVGEALGLSAEEIERGVAAYEPSGARMHVIELPEGRRLLDDCYNAGPQSMRAALEVLGRSEGRTAAVLGDMAELGELTVAAHREIGALARELGVGQVIAVGEKARDIAAAAGEGAQWFPTVDDALDAVRAAFIPGTAMLVKASHSMHFERITEELSK
ncbi:MAG: UDP-N-acetylmuramoyl-tripeptide--D-alanyl-D-alanine ligase [Ruminococcaceae bacterium]|nr:UDP-N-acetylmuramoyl-tripeptide--D-alanyl-D-alanine ligase [Oscillospiraceae bacterium]